MPSMEGRPEAAEQLGLSYRCTLCSGPREEQRPKNRAADPAAGGKMPATVRRPCPISLLLLRPVPCQGSGSAVPTRPESGSQDPGSHMWSIMFWPDVDQPGTCQPHRLHRGVKEKPVTHMNFQRAL